LEDRAFDGVRAVACVGAAVRLVRFERRRAGHVAMASPAIEQLLVAPLERGPVGEHFRAFAQPAVAYAAPHDPQAQLAEERHALGEAVDTEGVLGVVDESQLEVGCVVVEAHAS
jgi:hypothetical protein